MPITIPNYSRKTDRHKFATLIGITSESAVAAGTGIITSFAGGSGSSTADGVQATTASIPYNSSLAVDGSGNLYFTDSAYPLLSKLAG